MLQEQYRMHPEISRFPSARFYGGRLVDVLAGVSCQSHDLPPYAVVDIASGAEEIRRESHIINAREAEALAGFAKQLAYLHKRNRPTGSRCPALVVITFYNGQATLIRQLLGAEAGVEVHTVDSFQGSEAEVVLLSFVRANPQRRLGFLSEFRRLNVALTRAKRSLVVFANASLLARQSSDDVSALFEDAGRRKLIWREEQLDQLLSLARLASRGQAAHPREAAQLRRGAKRSAARSARCETGETPKRGRLKRPRTVQAPAGSDSPKETLRPGTLWVLQTSLDSRPRPRHASESWARRQRLTRHE